MSRDKATEALRKSILQILSYDRWEIASRPISPVEAGDEPKTIDMGEEVNGMLIYLINDSFIVILATVLFL